MRKLILFMTLVYTTVILTAQDSEIKEVEISVLGVCDMCKDRIEKAVDIDEVKYSKWDKRDKVLFVAYESSVTADSLQRRIAMVGHDTEKFKASPEAYNKLPKCCWYRDDVKTH